MDTNRLSVLHLTSAVGTSSFGLGAVVLELSRAQQRCGTNVTIWTNDDPIEEAAVRRHLGMPQTSLVTYPILGPRRLSWSPRMERGAIVDEAADVDVLHHHAVWVACMRASWFWHRRFRRPLVVAAHGALDPWALRRSRWKKWLASKAYAQRLFGVAACLHALGENELSAYRDFGLKNPVAVIPNGVSEEWLESRGEASAFRSQLGIPSDKRIMLYLSRVTPKKGLPLLFKAIAALRKQMTGWLLLIVGPDEFGHIRELEELASALGIEPYLRFLGPVYGDRRRDAFAAADVFVLPTYSEGNPIAVLEALGAGLPVLTTRGASCAYLVEDGCGWWTDIGSESIAEALDDVLRSSKDRLASMGARGREVVKKGLTWRAQAEKTVLLYRWLLGRAERPDFVILD